MKRGSLKNKFPIHMSLLIQQMHGEGLLYGKHCSRTAKMMSKARGVPILRHHTSSWAVADNKEVHAECDVRW